MNKEGEYVAKTQCPYCKHSEIINNQGYPGCMNIKGKNTCEDFAALAVENEVKDE